MDKLFRFLIVDDDEDWVRYCSKSLRNTKNAVFEISTSVDDAVRKIEEGLYDGIFCDYRMKYEDANGITHFDGGFRIRAEARAHTPQAKIVMVTAYGSADLARESLVQEQFDDYIEKNIDPRDDRERIAQYIEDLIENWNEGSVAANPFSVQRGHIPRSILTRYSDGKSHFEFFSEQLKVAQEGTQARFLVLGKVGLGKSCLLSHYKNYAQKRGYLVSQYEMSPNYSRKPVEEGLLELLWGIVRGFPKVRMLDLKGFVEIIKSLGGKIDAFGFKIGLEWDRKEIAPDSVLRNGIKGLIEDMKEKTDVIIILLDNIPSGSAMPDALKFFFQIMAENDFAGQPLVIGASLGTKDIEHGNFGALLDPIVNRFFAGHMFELSDFSERQIHQLVLETLVGTGVSFDEKIVSRVYEYCKGHPFVLQLLCKYLYDNQVGGRVEDDALDVAIQNCKVELDSFISEFFCDLSKEEQVVLHLVSSSYRGLTLKGLQGLLLDMDMTELIPKGGEICGTLLHRNVLRQDRNGIYYVNFS